MPTSTTFTRLLRCAAALCMFAASAVWAQAPAPSLSLTFLQPSGTVGASDSIPVFVRFTNNDAALSFVVDNTLPNGGLDASIVPTSGGRFDADGNYITAPFASYTSFRLSTGFGCSGSFTSECSQGQPYTFDFADNPFSDPFALAAGAHIDYLFGTFIPSAGPVAAGTYEFYRSVVWLDVAGLDANNNVLTTVVFPSSTCDGNSAAECANAGFFSRTVLAVPEPASQALMGLGLALVGWLARRRVVGAARAAG